MADSARPNDRLGPRLAYSLELNGETISVVIPTVLGVIGDFGLTSPEDRRALGERRFVLVEVEDVQRLARSQEQGNSVHRLARLVDLAAADPSIRIRVLDVNKAELATDIQRARGLDETALWKKIYRDEFGTFGGEPYTMILVDFSFAADSADMAMLEAFAKIGAEANCPFIAAAAPRMFGTANSDAIPGPERLDALFASRPYADWHALRNRDEARFVALTVFGDALGTGAALVGVYAKTGLWTQASQLPCDAAQPRAQDPRENALARHGFLVSHAALRDACTAQRPKRFHQPERTALEAITARLAHVLTSAQFLRTVTHMSTHHFGAFDSVAGMEAFLDRWIQEYVDDGEPAKEGGAKAPRPLAEAKLQLRDVLGAPGQIETVLSLRINLPDVRSDRCTHHTMRTVLTE